MRNTLKLNVILQVPKVVTMGHTNVGLFYLHNVIQEYVESSILR